MTLVMKEGLKEGTTFHFTVSPMVCFKLRLLGYRPEGMVFDRPNVDVRALLLRYLLWSFRELTNLSVELAYYLGGTWAQEGYPFGASQGDGF